MHELHALNYYYFESMLMLIVILWFIKWLFAYQIVKDNTICKTAED